MTGAPGDGRLLALLSGLPSGTDLAVVRDGPSWLVGVDPERLVRSGPGEGIEIFDAFQRGWWAGYLSYDAGRRIERVTPRIEDDEQIPDVTMARFDGRVRIAPDGTIRLEGDGASRATLRAVVRGALSSRSVAPVPALRDWRSDVDQETYVAGVREALGLIQAGECYQVNLARRLTCPTAADPVALFCALVRGNPTPHAALLCLDGLAVVSASPELFLRRRQDLVQTRPIKGTGTSAAALALSRKDRAENVMIVDLARNDLGRVCTSGSVRVSQLCHVEQHPGLLHLVSTVEGSLRSGVSLSDLLRATFPPASITGAPKPRVLQAIEDLERSRRGVYCGSVGWIDLDRDELDLNVAIRTFTVVDGATHLGVGAGIVADSDPELEWQETELKAARLLRLAGRRPPVAVQRRRLGGA